MPDVGASGLRQPPTNGVGYGSKSFSGSAAIIIPPGEQTGSIAFRADPNNSDTVYIGFDDNVSASNGFPLQAGDIMALDLDTSDQAVYGTGPSGNDIRWIATN